MTPKIFFKAFVAGMCLPAIVTPIAYSVPAWSNPTNITAVLPGYLYPMYMPLLFGLANVLFIRISRKVKRSHHNILYCLIGILLGLFVATLHITSLIFGVFFSPHTYMSFIALPILYALIFRFIIKKINQTFDL